MIKIGKKTSIGYYAQHQVILRVTIVCCRAKDSEEEIVDGIRIIHNFISGKEPRQSPFSIEEDLPIKESGGDENYIFTNPVDIDADSLGNIYILDNRDCTAKVFDRDGRYVRSIGKQGRESSKGPTASSSTAREDSLSMILIGIKSIFLIQPVNSATPSTHSTISQI